MSAVLAFLVGLLWDSIWLRLAWKILAPKLGWKKKGRIPVIRRIRGGVRVTRKGRLTRG